MSAPVAAQKKWRPHPAGKRRVSLQELQNLSLQHNPTIEQARASTQQAYGLHRQAGRYKNPKIGYIGEDMGDGGKAGQQGIFFQQEFITADKRLFAQSVTSLEIRRVEQGYSAQEIRVLNSVRREFYAVLTAHAMGELAVKLKKISKKGRDLTEARFVGRQGNKRDKLLALVEYNGALTIYDTAEIRYAAAWRRLQSVVGDPNLHPMPLSGDLYKGFPNLNWDHVWSRMLDSNPQLEQASLGAAKARAATEYERRRPKPNVTVRVGTKYDNATNTQLADLQISLPLPLFDRNRGNITAAQANATRAYYEERRMELALKRKLTDAFREYRSNRALVERFAKKTMPALNEALQLTQASFDAGDIDYRQPLIDQRTFTDKNRKYVKALGQLWQNVIAIEGQLLVDGLAAP